jgi:hypothetical protein
MNKSPQSRIVDDICGVRMKLEASKPMETVGFQKLVSGKQSSAKIKK